MVLTSQPAMPRCRGSPSVRGLTTPPVSLPRIGRLNRAPLMEVQRRVRWRSLPLTAPEPAAPVRCFCPVAGVAIEMLLEPAVGLS